MSLGACIPGMVKRGEIDAARAKRMSELFDELERYYARTMGPDAAAAEASEATLKQLAAEARLKKRQTLLQIARQRDAVKDIATFKGSSGFDAVGALLDDHDQAPYRGGNITTKTTIIESDAHRRVAGFIERHRRNLLGRPQDASGLDDVARELHGQDTGNARAKVFAEALGETFEQLRQRFNAAGGNIRKLAGYGLPHRWDAMKVRAVPFEQWLGDMVPELGAGMQDAAQSLSALARYHGDAAGPGWTSVAADSVLRASGLNRVTKAAQDVAYLDAMRTLGSYRETAWAKLPDELRSGLEGSGIAEVDWTAARHAEPLIFRGLPHIDPKAIADRNVADRLAGYALRYVASSVQESTPTLRAVTSLGTRGGTAKGEIVRSMVQLKGFAIGMLIKQGRILRTLNSAGRARYLASLAVRMTVAGALTIQLRELAKGNDVLPMDTIEFWEKSALQSGGLGVIGDLFGAVQDAVQGGRVGSLAEYVAGPVVSDVEKSIDITRTAFPGLKPRQDGSRRVANPGGAAVRALDFISPASSLWYLRAAWERMVIDQARSEADPTDGMTAARRTRQLKTNRQGQWWANGDLAPARAPDLMNALGTAQEAQQ